ncbi:bacitracin ABC transporter ATP-binding protein [Salipaludibacillus keqinensis]|uniref:Bacitracin ABC transporter ATP-binding protein n=1 Tax=Salipaludibacillus keqinensis TaxID=2045207 RepID=A0A323TMC4_9BACI|nr:ABC transporter ATP-binding protein [Salipaludibacillus keqinensis]PYZ94797.1 bacitracin ABC transporter ATP-binding protein [Salipaludibacillus keqinensis]
MGNQTYLLETNGLTKTYKGAKVVNGLSLQLEEGEIYGFLGPNGAGKTTTIRMLLGLIKPAKGRVTVFGKDLSKERITILKQIGSLVESPSYYPHLTGKDNLETLRKILQVPKSRIAEVLEMVRLTKMADRKVKEYSLGMKQRLGLAASLLGSPKLLILDEPTNGLDPAGMIYIRELIKQLPVKYGMTVLLSSHLLSEIDQVATKVGIIAKGEMIFQDQIDVLREKASRKLHVQMNDWETGQKVLSRHGIETARHDNWLTMPNQPDGKIAEIVKELVYSGLDIYRVSEEIASLEDIFLNLTKGEETL